MYWYEDSDARHRSGQRVLEALRHYRAAEIAMRRRTRDSMGMGENDLLVLQYLLRAKRQGREVSPSELAKYLAVSTPSVTGILDRLERSGHLVRESHPDDRRRVIVRSSDMAAAEVNGTLRGMHARMMEVVSSLSAEDAAVVTQFLRNMTDAVDTIDLPAHP